MKYEEAMKRLEQIVSDIEEGKLDIDLVSERLKEAKELITLCKDKLFKVDADVKKILEDQP